MGIGGFIKKVFNIKDSSCNELFKNLKGLPEERAKEELSLLLHDICVSKASDFVDEEMNKRESPFRGSQRNIFLHEMVVVNYWIVDKVVSGKKREITAELHKNYHNSFNPGKAFEDNSAFLSGRYKTYYDTWNDDTGNQRDFGLKAAEHIFGGSREDRLMDTAAFWIVFYTDGMMKNFLNMRQDWRREGVKI